MRALLLRLISLLVPYASRNRWYQEWRAELEHGGWRMLPGALPDAWTMRRLGWDDQRLWSGGRAGWLHAIDQDVRQALRSSVDAPGFTIAVVGSLAIGIGATTAAFAMVNAVLFRAFPQVQGQERLATVKITPNRAVWYPTSWNDYELLRDGITSFERLSIAHDATFAVAPGGGHEPRQAHGLVVSTSYFDVLGVRPSRGRFFRPDEDDKPWAQPAVVISHRYWLRHLAGDPEVLRRTVNVNGIDLPVIGVAAEGFAGVFTSGEPELYVTFALSDLVFRDKDGHPVHARRARPFTTTLIGRLRPGATIEQAAAQAATLEQPIRAANDRGEKQLFVQVEPLRIADAGRYWPYALALMAVPVIVLLVACVNAANLLLARASRRNQDWIVRLSLGATRWRLIRQMLVESLLLAFAAAACGLMLAHWGTGVIQQFATAREIVIDLNVTLFVIGTAVGTALVFGLGPAVSVTRAAMREAPTRNRGRRGPFGSRTRAGLVVVQAALCLGLLATGAQFIKTLHSTWDEGLPDAGKFLVVSLNVDKLRYDRPQSEAFYRDLLERVQHLPEVRAAALTGRSASAMLGGWVSNWGVHIGINGVPESPRGRSLVTYATAGFFDAMGLRISHGRTFTGAEQRGPTAAVIVNEAFARKIGGEALGRVIQLFVDAEDGKRTVTDAMIVGILAATPNRPIFSRLPHVFHSVPLVHAPAVDLVLRVERDGEGIAAAVRTIVSAMEPRLPLADVATGEDLRRRRHASEYRIASTVSMLGGLALILAAAGLYGVVSYMVTMRQREIGIRMALGARRATVLRLILRQSIVPVTWGCVLGAAGAATAASLIRSRLYGVSAMDPVAFGGAALLLVATMIVAAVVPARRAARVNPIEVLRAE